MNVPSSPKPEFRSVDDAPGALGKLSTSVPLSQRSVQLGRVAPHLPGRSLPSWLQRFQGQGIIALQFPGRAFGFCVRTSEEWGDELSLAKLAGAEQDATQAGIGRS